MWRQDADQCSRRKIFGIVPFACVRLLLVFVTLGCCYAQTAGVQFTYGVPISGFNAIDLPFRYGSVESSTKRYVAGIFGELLFKERIGFEVGALYSRTELTGGTRSVSIWPITNAEAAGGAWHVPISAKYRITRGAIAPFVVAGPVLTRTGVSGQSATVAMSLSGPITTTTNFSESSVSSGWSVGGGADIRIGRGRLSPQVRYMRSDALKCRGCDLPSDFPALNPVYIMVSAGF
jgi:hypothetical protein